MELLIPGLVLVALMVYASTRLKKATARALEAEDVETDEFSITKPAGFINVVSPDDGLLFKAYTKEYADDAPNFPRAEATITVRGSFDIPTALSELEQSGGIVSVKAESEDAGSPYIVRIDREEGGSTIRRSVKLVQKGDRVYSFRFDSPASCDEEFLVARREMNDSLTIKG